MRLIVICVQAGTLRREVHSIPVFLEIWTSSGPGEQKISSCGNGVNLAARLCDEAKDGQILINHKAFVEVEEKVEAESTGSLALKGFSGDIRAYNVLDVRY